MLNIFPYRLHYTLLIIGMVSSVCFLQAQTDTSNKVNQLQDVVVTGQYGQGSISQSVYKIRVIDAKRIELQGAVNLANVLQNELNVRIQNDPVLGSGINIQGIGGQNIKIMVDGIPVVGREGGSIDLTQINTNQIERIELVEGPMSVNFGTDALGGVINIITKKDTKRIYQTQLTSYYETVGQYNIGINNSFRVKKWNLQLNGARNFFDGYNTDANARNQIWKPREQYFGDFAMNRSFKRSQFRYAYQFFDEKVTNRDSGTISPWGAYAIDQYYFTRRHTHSAFYTHKLDKQFTIQAVASASFYRRMRHTYRKDLVSLDEQLIPSNDLQDTNYNQLWMSRGSIARNLPNKKLNYEVGYEVNHEVYSGSRIQDERQQMNDYNLFGSLEWKPLSRLLVRPGLRYIYNTNYKAPLIPSVNLKWDLYSWMQLRGSYARGFRAPSLKELYLDFVDPSHNVQGNPDLQAETSNNFQLNVAMQWSKFERVFRVEPGLFFNDVFNKIDLSTVSSNTIQVRYFNINEFQSGGINLNTEYRAPNYSFVFGYAYMGTRTAYNEQIASLPVNYSNEIRFNASYHWNKPGIRLSSFLKYNSKLFFNQFNTTTNTFELGYISGFTLWDMTLNKLFLSNRLECTAGVRNLLNISNVNASLSAGVHSSAANAAAVAMGRTFFVSLKYTIHWKT